MTALTPSPRSSDSPQATSEPPPASSWAAPPEFYIDENTSGRSLSRFLRDLGYVVHTPTSVFGRQRLQQTLEDKDWLPVIGANDWVIFGRDQHILDRPHELQAYRSAKVHMFMLPGSASREEIIGIIKANLREICELAVARRPNVYWLTATRVVAYERRQAEVLRRRRR